MKHEDAIKQLEILLHNFNDEYIRMINDDQLKILYEQVEKECIKRFGVEYID